MDRLRIIRVLPLVIAVLGTLGSPMVGHATGIGIKVGPTYASQNFEGETAPGIDRNTRSGFAFGGVIELPFSPGLSIRFEPMYVQKGSEIDWPSHQDILDSTVRFDYLSVPVTLKLAINAGGFSPYIFAGPSVSFTTKSDVKLSESGEVSKLDVTDTDFSFDFGAGAGIPLTGFVSAIVELRYVAGLSDVKLEGATGAVNNRATLVMLGVMIEI